MSDVSQWIAEQLKAGHDAKTIYDLLLQSGHKPDDIYTAFHLARQQLESENTGVPRHVFLLAGIILIGLTVFLLLPTGNVTTAELPAVTAAVPVDIPPEPATSPGVKAPTPPPRVVSRPPTETTAGELPLSSQQESSTKRLSLDSDAKKGVFVCSDWNCFNKRFEECLPTEGQRQKSLLESYAYEIRGETKSGCEVLVLALEHPTKKGETMLCRMPSGKDFVYAMRDAECEGPLADDSAQAREENLVDCGRSMDCFDDAKKTCANARVLTGGHLMTLITDDNGDCQVVELNE